MQRTANPNSRQRAGKVSPAAAAKPSAGELLQDHERLLDENELEIVLGGRSRSRIQKDRLEGRGPPFIKIGRLIRYRAGDVRDYLRSCTVRPTLQPQSYAEPPHA